MKKKEIKIIIFVLGVITSITVYKICTLYIDINNLQKQNKIYKNTIKEYINLTEEIDIYKTLIENGDVLNKNSKELEDKQSNLKKDVDKLNNDINNLTNNIKKIS